MILTIYREKIRRKVMAKVENRAMNLNKNQNWTLKISWSLYGRRIIRLRIKDLRKGRPTKRMIMFLILRINVKDSLMYRLFCIHFFFFLTLFALLFCSLGLTNSPLTTASLAAVLICLNLSGPMWVPPNHLLTTTITFHASII